MIAQFQQRKKKNISVGAFFGSVALIIILLMIGFFVFSNIKIKQTKNKLNIQLAAIEKEIGDIQKKNEGLEEKIAHVGDEDYIEKVAREELNLQKEEEKVVGFIMPSLEEEKNSGNYWYPQNWWGFIKDQWELLKSKF